MKKLKKLVAMAITIVMLTAVTSGNVVKATEENEVSSEVESELLNSDDSNTADTDASDAEIDLRILDNVATQEELDSYHTNTRKEELVENTRDEEGYVHVSSLYVTTDELKHFSNALDYGLINSENVSTTISSEEFDKLFFYYHFLDLIDSEHQVLVDCSWSMNNTFRWSKIEAARNFMPYLYWDSFKFSRLFEEDSSSSEIFKTLNTLANSTDKSKTKVLLSDLWDNTLDKLEENNSLSLIVFVPYQITNADGVIHCDDMAKKILAKWKNSTIYIAYMDEAIVEYNNLDGAIDVVTYVP
jgi:hypothetical protein